MDKGIKKLGDAELEIMFSIWQAEKAVTSSYILEQLQYRRNWALSTLMTSLSRLCEKGFLSCDRTTGVNLYTPVISEEEYKSKETGSFLEKMYGSSFQGLVTNLFSSKVIDQKDISELRCFLDQLEQGEKKE